MGRSWTLRGPRLPVDAAGFRVFDRPGYARAVWDFRLVPVGDGATRLSTETRIACTDASSRRLRRYRRVVRLCSGLIRIALLRAIARETIR